MTAPASSVAHATFVIRHDYEASPSQAFGAFADQAAKRRWFVEGEGWTVDAYELDFRVSSTSASAAPSAAASASRTGRR